jgi:uncharacterized protein (AIM24 family)
MQKRKITTSVIETHEYKGVKLEVLEYIRKKAMHGLGNTEPLAYKVEEPDYAYRLLFKLQNDGIFMEGGLLHYMYGTLAISTSSALTGLSSMMKRTAAGEGTSLTEVKGTGEVYLEPTHGEHFLIVELDNDTLIADKGLFYAGSNSLKISAEMQSNISSAIFGGEGLFQTKVEGSGIVVFQSPVPVEELVCIELNNEKLSVDGTFAILRTGNIAFKVEKSAKTMLGSMKSGEGLLQTFSGTGKVWIAPSMAVHQVMR